MTRLIRYAIVGVILGMQVLETFAQQQEPVRPRRGSTVVDDTTKSVYGPKTTTWTTEESIFQNKNKYFRIDTSIVNYHRWTYIQRFNNFYQDLGNVGTAMSPIFPSLTGTVGVTSGFTTYAPYYQTEAPHYFDTKSPYTRIYVVWGGNGRAMTRVEFSRNISPRWNFGFNYRPILVDRQIQYVKADRQTISHYYDFYTTYRSKNDRYQLLFDYRRIRHQVYESGGVKTNSDAYEDLFDPDAALYLTEAVTEEKRANIHLFQQLQLARPAQVYLTTDYFIQRNKFKDKPDANALKYFDYTYGDSTQTNDVAELETFQNEAGLKGSAGPLFYNFYFKNRAYTFENSYLTTSNGQLMANTKQGTERYLGGRVALTFDSVTEFSGMAEYLLEGYYKLDASWKSPWIDAFGKSSLSKPGLMQQTYYGNHDAWNNTFDGTSSIQFGGFLKGQFGPLFVSPGLTFSSFHNYIYFNERIDTLNTTYQRVLPVQSSGAQTIISPELRLTLTVLKHIQFRPQVIYTQFLKNDDNAFHIPELFFNGQISYHNFFFKGNLELQTGLDFHWQSAYNALAYDPSIQQFYIQDPSTQFVSPTFLLADVFFNAKLKRGKFFVKYSNVGQAFKGTGYIPTPGYPGQRNIMDFGFELLLFD